MNNVRNYVESVVVNLRSLPLFTGGFLRSECVGVFLNDLELLQTFIITIIQFLQLLLPVAFS